MSRPAPSPTDRPSPRSERALAVLLPAIAAVALYGPAIVDTQWILDDVATLATHLHEGDVLGEWRHPTFAWATGTEGHVWRPLMASVQQLAAQLLGRSAQTFRTLGVLFHAINGALLASLALSLGLRPLLAALLALAFVVHPAAPEAVAWSSALGDLLCATGLLVALRWALGGTRGRTGPWVFGLLIFLAATSKESAVVAPIALSPILLWHHGRRGLLFSIGGLTGAGLYVALHAKTTGFFLIGTAGSSPLMAQIQAALGYIGWLVFLPAQAPLAHLYDPNDWWAPTLGLITLAGLSVLAWHLVRRGGGEGWALACAALAWAMLLLPAGMATPMAGPQPFRYLYMPLALTLAIALYALPRPSHRPGVGAPWQVGLGRAGVGLVLGLIFWSILSVPRVLGRVDAYHDQLSLWEAEWRLEPENPWVGIQLGRNLVTSGQIQEGLILWDTAIDNAPQGYQLVDVQAARYEIAQAAYLSGLPQLSLYRVRQYIEVAGELGQRVPANAFCLLADSLDGVGRHDDALRMERHCVEAAAPDPGIDLPSIPQQKP